ncbi:MAG: hypothetical protein D4R64_14500 [Porphyromonadaceae bacterium]|nr:MAG: hypothetical protein D4R64_14500 [Porphyromonadaceae bacterium]
MKTKEIKNYPWKLSLILGILMLMLPGCLDIWITTQIRPDGSIEQIIVFQGDSAEIADVPFALMKEGDWKKEWTKPEKDKYKLIVSKEFNSVKDLNKSMNPADTNQQVIRINASLQRKFRWFFTRYVYAETIQRSNPFPGLDYHNYLTDEEIRLIALNEETRKTDPGYDSVKYKVTEKRFEEFLFRSMYEDFYQQLVSVLAEDKSFTLSKQVLDSKKDVIYHFLIDSVKGDSSDELLSGVGRAINHPDIQVVRSKYLSRFDGFKTKMKFYESASDDSYKFTIRMPGLLLQTNSPKIEGSETGWELTYYDFFFKDYTITAESRKVNTWAFIVAGLVLLVALVSLITALLRKR